LYELDLSSSEKVVVGLQVTWRKAGDHHPITIGRSTFVSDSRIAVNFVERLAEWRLMIVNVRQTDTGVYKCQVNTKDDQSNFYSFCLQVKSRFYASIGLSLNY